MWHVEVARPFAALCLAAAAPVLVGAIGDETNFDARVLAAHNRERLSVGAPPLVWDDGLAVGAKDWAQHLAETGAFAHSPDRPGSEPIGENIWGGTANRYQPEAMVDLWIAEKKLYRPGTFPANSTTGDVHDVSHYTQLIWRSSRSVGCGVSRGAHEDILVCRYSAAGNMIGQRPI